MACGSPGPGDAETMTQGVRITMQRADNGPSKTVVIVEPPFPAIGDCINYLGMPWFVQTTESTEVLAIVRRGVIRRVSKPNRVLNHRGNEGKIGT